jgi:hypothetical protein
MLVRRETVGGHGRNQQPHVDVIPQHKEDRHSAAQIDAIEALPKAPVAGRRRQPRFMMQQRSASKEKNDDAVMREFGARRIARGDGSGMILAFAELSIDFLGQTCKVGGFVTHHK